MQELHQALNLWPVVYIARDIERALSLPITTKGYWIITNSSPLAKELTRKHKNILIINAKEPLDTHELLEHPRTIALLKKLNARPLPTLPSAEERGRDSSSPLQRRGQEERSHSLINILVFKNTLRIEKICKEHSWRLLNPRAELANRVEQKLAQLEWLGPLKKYLPPHQVMKCKELTWPNQTSLPVLSPSSEGLRSAEARRNRPSPLQRRGQGEVSPFIVQFNHAHTGTGTILIESQKQIVALQKKFPNREVRVTQFIQGPVFTNNNVVWGKRILCGNINFQITGLAPFTDRPFATVGNDWTLPHRVLSSKQNKQYKQIATDVGKRLQRDGWKGLFGIDVIMDEKTGGLYLIEINARQPASTTFESQLQSSVILSAAKNLVSKRHQTRSFATAQDDKWVTTFEAHLAALLGLKPIAYSLISIADGAQVVQRVAEENKKTRKQVEPKRNPLAGKIKAIAKLKNSGLNVIVYPNKNPGEDLLRIQSKQGIMETPNKFNWRGEKIRAALLPKPKVLENIDLNFLFPTGRELWKMKLPTKRLSIKKLLWMFGYPFWEKEGTDDWNLTPWEVIKNPKRQPTHYKKIISSDLNYPIIVTKYQGRWRVLDGLHRLVKAYIHKQTEVKVKIIPKNKQKNLFDI